MAKGSLSALVCALVLVGCGSVPVPPEKARPAPADRVTWDTTTGDARITVVRDGPAAVGCFKAIYVNGKLAARLAAAERVDLAVPSGELVMAMTVDPLGRALCDVGLVERRVTREVTIRPGEHKTYRMRTDANGTFDVVRADS